VFDPFHADSMFCTVSGYRDAIYTPHVFKAALGSPWSDISGDLPDHPANAIEPLNDSIWVLATDYGVYLTRNYGVNWVPIAAGDGPGLMPMIPVYDLAVDLDPGADSATAERLLVAATYARSLHSFPLDSLVPIDAPDPGPDSTDQVLETGITESFDLVAYPSPFVDQLMVELEAGQRWTSLEVFDGAGRLVERQTGGRTARFETNNWPAGLYILRAKLDDGGSEALTVLKR